MSQAKARAMLQQAVSQSRHEMWDAYEEQMNANEAAKERSFWAGLGGSILVPILLNAVVPGAGLIAMSLAAGVGSRVGSEVGEHGGVGKAFRGEGGVVSDFGVGSGFGSADLGRQLEQNVEDAWGGFDTSQWADAATATATAFIAGGGSKAAKAAFAPGSVPAASGIGPPLQTPAPGIVGGMKNLMAAPYEFNPLQFLWSSYLNMPGGEDLSKTMLDEDLYNLNQQIY